MKATIRTITAAIAGGEVINWFNFLIIGVTIVVIKKLPNLFTSMMAVMIKQSRRVTTSTNRSMMTVPSSLLNGTNSALLKAPQRVTSPNRGNARFAKYPMLTA
jgi:Sec-independent protein translocase protein TatA